MSGEKCKDYGQAVGCLEEADPLYMMDFSDVGKPPFHWCAVCGPKAHKMAKALLAKLEEDPTFEDRLRTALTKAQEEEKAGAN